MATPKLKEKTDPEIYQAGYDLWRDNEEIKKITQKQAFAAVASELFQALPLRYAFDQYFSMIQCTAGSPYDVPLSLQEISCLNPLAGGLILPLEDLAFPPTFFPMPLKEAPIHCSDICSALASSLFHMRAEFLPDRLCAGKNIF